MYGLLLLMPRNVVAIAKLWQAGLIECTCHIHVFPFGHSRLDLGMLYCGECGAVIVSIFAFLCVWIKSHLKYMWGQRLYAFQLTAFGLWMGHVVYQVDRSLSEICHFCLCI